MIAIEVSLNDEKIITAGSEELCLLYAVINAGGKLGSDSSGTSEHKTDIELSLSVGGTTARAEEVENDVLSWAKLRPIQLGDSIRLRFVESSHCDNAIDINPTGGIAGRVDERKMFESVKATYLMLKDKYE